MNQRVIANPSICGHDCSEPCVDAWPAWEMLGKGVQIDSDDKDMVDGVTAAYTACTRGAIQFKRV